MSSQDEAAHADASSDQGIGQHDERPIWRCPQLGGPVTFGYCRQMNQSLPCARVVACWGEAFDVQAFLQQYYDPDEIAQIESGASRGRLDIISEALQRVLNRREGNSAGE